MAVIDAAIAQAREAIRLELDRQVAKKRDAHRSGASLALKQKITRKRSDLFSILQARADDDVMAVMARESMETAFPKGVAGISKQSFEDMLGTLQTLVESRLGSASPG